MRTRLSKSIMMLPATGSAWSDLCKRITTKPPCQVKFQALPTNGAVAVMWSFVTACSSCGSDIEVGDVRSVPDGDMSEAEMVAWLRECALRTLAHELDECLMLDGKLVNDQHPLSSKNICDHPVVGVVLRQEELPEPRDYDD